MQLDLFLASLMRESDYLTNLLARANITPQSWSDAKTRARAAHLLEGRRVPQDEIVRLFGKPTQSAENVLRYGLELWPEHIFEWCVDPNENAFPRGFALMRPALDLPPSLSVTVDLIYRPFRLGIHTMNEVERILGPASGTVGWGALEDWAYPLAGGENPIVFEFDFGLLVNIDRREVQQL